ncbi:hypothetical protein AB0N05_21900 [Nocardia sp. NPDC051030]|uniref:TY-Chap domain-containing protein n=1 Tax=Nocardia sp. NPDC051030 TaxID=3155162 RepID=UPI00343B0506
MTDWDKFTDRLAEQLSTLPDGAVVTLSGAGPSTSYVVHSQVVQLSDAVWGEFQGRPKSDRETPFGTDSTVMTTAGWQPPGNTDHGTNWWIELPWPSNSANYRRLATMIVTGFRRFHQIPSPTALTYDAWNTDARNHYYSLELPLLGIPSLRDSQKLPDPPPAPVVATRPAWPSLEYDEVMTLATQLISLDPAWQHDPDLVARTFRWVMRELAPGVYQLDTGPETAKGYLYWKDGRAQALEIPISTPIPDDDQPRLGYRYTLLTPTLYEALGDSTEPPSTYPSETTWVNADLRLVVFHTLTDIRLLLVPKR